MAKGKMTDTGFDELTAGEAKVTERPVVVLRRCATNTDHNPGDVIMWKGDLPPNGIVRELLPEEREERERIMRKQIADRGAFDKENEEAMKVDVRSDQIMMALSRLKPEDDNDWTETGQPLVMAVNRELTIAGVVPVTTSRAEILAFAPSFLRPVIAQPGSVGAAAEGAAEGGI